MKPKLERTVFLIHWLVFLAFVFFWVLLLTFLVANEGPILKEFIRFLFFGEAHKGLGGILLPMVMYVLPIAFLAGDWIATGKITVWPWKRKLPPKNS